MAANPPENPASNELQFTTAEVAGEAVALGPACAACKNPIASTYFVIGETMFCPSCIEQVNASPTGSKFGRLLKASLLGLGAGLIGAIIWFAIRRVTNLEIGLVAILVGFMVGKAVRAGSGDRGGLGYQVLAVVITYCCIAANYMPDILEVVFDRAGQKHAAAPVGKNNDDGKPPAEAAANADPAATPVDAQHEEPEEPVSTAQLVGAVAMLLMVVFALSLAAPFLAGAQNLIGLLIIGFALWEAWKFNARRALPISGPYTITPGTAT